jgi:formate hydrogenlyase transcriptional activator
VLIQEDYFKNIFNTVREAILVLDENMRVLSANRSFFNIFKVDTASTIGSLLYDLGNGQWNIPYLRVLLEDILPKNDTVDDYEIEHNFESIGRKIMLLNACKIAEKKNDIPIILLAIEDITERREIENGLEKARKELEVTKISEDEAREYAESIINTVREPLIALDQNLRVVSASRSFYEVFKVNPKETVGQLIYDLGNKQWDIPKLRELLETILPQKTTFDNYEVEHDFFTIGRRIMLLNARQIQRVSGKERIILLAIEDITERKRLEDLLTESEERYRRLFETASDGIVLLEKREGNITHANPATEKMLGYSEEECIGKNLQDIGVSLDMSDFPTIMQTLNKSGIINYDDVQVRTKSGQYINTDIYMVDRARLAQCNIRDVTERKRDEEALYRRDLELRTALSEIKTLKDQLEAENIIFRQEIKMRHQFDHILGQSDGLKYVLYRAEQVAPMNTTVLILGETGTGKELIAAAIHDMSLRKERPLITVNCAALPANLIESELFGREKGAFTGADTRQAGRFDVANGSTLCLDEIGELPLEVQAKLLRVIQHNEFERLGSSHTIKVDVRIIATTNRDLELEVRKGRFRQDLYYRLNVFPITVPPLRQRKEDIPLMVQAFKERYSRKLGKQITSIQKETMKLLQDYPWPGNVRELENIIERAVILCPGPVLQLADKLDISSLPLSSTVRTLEETERNQILKILSETRWRIEGKDGAAAILGLHPSTLRARMHKLGLVRPGTK